MEVAALRRMVGLCIAMTTASWIVPTASQTAAGDVQDDFESGTLSEERWYLSQADLERIDFDETTPRQGRRSLLIGVDETIREADARAEEAASLRFSLVDPPTLDSRGRPCPPATDIAETVVQRNEIRVAAQLQPFFGDALWYGFSLKALGDIPACGGVRWVIGQWKHTTADSPFLAQRFDNGVFHVTVQDDHCRCRVTQAPGDPDRQFLAARDTPLRCVNTDEHSPDEGKPCESALRVRYGDDPTLPDIKQGWVDMLYHVRGGRDGGGQRALHRPRDRPDRGRGRQAVFQDRELSQLRPGRSPAGLRHLLAWRRGSRFRPGLQAKALRPPDGRPDENAMA
jgi:Polysaccharide lyase